MTNKRGPSAKPDPAAQLSLPLAAIHLCFSCDEPVGEWGKLKHHSLPNLFISFNIQSQGFKKKKTPLLNLPTRIK